MKDLIILINGREYDEAFRLLCQSFDSLKDDFEMDVNEHPSEKLFRFAVFAGEKANDAPLVYFCSMLLATSLNHFEGAYTYSYKYAWKFAKMEPYQIENWEYFLFFDSVPDIEVSKTDLAIIVLNLLKLDSSHSKALNLLNSKFTENERLRILKSI